MMTGGGTYPNLFCAHPPFQIDGNFGFAAAIVEMLIQGDENRIELLPALPKAFNNGYVKGIRARGGYCLDISWKNGRVKSIRITAVKAGSVNLFYHGKEDIVVFEDGELIKEIFVK